MNTASPTARTSLAKINNGEEKDHDKEEFEYYEKMPKIGARERMEVEVEVNENHQRRLYGGFNNAKGKGTLDDSCGQIYDSVTKLQFDDHDMKKEISQDERFGQDKEEIELGRTGEIQQQYLSMEFTTKLLKLRALAESEGCNGVCAVSKELSPGLSSPESHTVCWNKSGEPKNNEEINSIDVNDVVSVSLQHVIDYLQELTRQQCLAEEKNVQTTRGTSVQSKGKTDDKRNGCQNNFDRIYKNFNENSSSASALKIEMQPPECNSGVFGPILWTFGSKTSLSHVSEKKNNEHEQGKSELPILVQQMMKNNKSLKRLITTGCLTISQIEESPFSTPTDYELRTINPLTYSTENQGILSSGKPKTDWSQFPYVSKLLMMRDKIAEDSTHAEQEPTGPFSADACSYLPRGNGSGYSMEMESMAEPSFKRRKTNFLGKDLAKFSASPASEANIKLISQCSSLPLLTSRSDKLSNSCTPLAAAVTKPSLAQARENLQVSAPTPPLNIPKLCQTRRMVSSNGHYFHRSRIISDELDINKTIHDRDPSVLNHTVNNQSSVLDEFDPMKFVEVTLQDGGKDFGSKIAYMKSVKAKSPKSNLYNELPRKFPCPHCEKSFSNKWCIKRHVVTHTGERPFSCPHCESRFTRSHYMRKHVTKFHYNEMLLNQREKSPEASTSANSFTPTHKPRKPRISTAHTGSEETIPRILIEVNGKLPIAKTYVKNVNAVKQLHHPKVKAVKLENGSRPKASEEKMATGVDSLG